VLQSIPTGKLVGLRDRAIIGVLIYTAARAGAVARLRLADFYTDGRQWFFRFDEKGGKVRDIPARHDLECFVREHIRAAGIEADSLDRPLFRTAAGRTDRLTRTAMSAKDILRMVKRRFTAAGLPANLTCHTFRATTITDLLEQGVNVPQRYTHPVDPKDSAYINLALATDSELVVSRDRHLLSLMDGTTPEGCSFQRRFPQTRSEAGRVSGRTRGPATRQPCG